MTKEYIIGREGNQLFNIDNKYNAVSRRHARLTINEDSGEWRLCDMESANGTFILDSKGQQIPVTEEITITPTTHISLGGTRYNALTIVAHALVDGGKDYGEDFNELEMKLADLKQRAAKKRNELKWRRIILALIPIVFLLIPGFEMTARIVGVTISSLLNAVLASMDDPTTINEERRRTIVCPQCRRELTDKDVERHSCPCGAH